MQLTGVVRNSPRTVEINRAEEKSEKPKRSPPKQVTGDKEEDRRARHREVLPSAQCGSALPDLVVLPHPVHSNTEIALLKKTLAEKYGDDLVKIFNGELSGDLKKVILTAIRGKVADFDASVHTSAKAAADADALYKAGEGRMGTDETTFIHQHPVQDERHGRDRGGVLWRRQVRALLFLVRSVLEPVELLAELFETTLKSAGKNAYGLSTWVVRYYRLLVHIRIVYMRLYRQELRTRIEGVVSGEYRQLLLSVLDAAEAEFGASAEAEFGSSGSPSASGSASGSTSASAGVSSSSAVVSGSSAAVSGAAIGASVSVEG
ncbi:hypothetical protein V7S43_017770 [Phytophthora oleae]|uniref:Uncharacterized protein n=1 Tax=Phytophthora oleae TaxID=2107226 RepID=A0ABD3ESD5_9STRA